MVKKHQNHNIRKDKHRPRTHKHTLSEKIKIAQQSSLRQRPKAVITLPTAPWMQQ